jgi:hypothetical protein
MEIALAIAALLNSQMPNILLMVKKRDGTVTILQILDEADAQYDANIKQIMENIKAVK